MKWKVNTRKVITEIVCYLFVFLFVYAALSKILEFENFQTQLGQSSILGAYTGLISYSIIIIELIISVMLVIPRLKFLGLFASFSIMSFFTFYIFIILNFSSSVPCSCGGILEKMSWKAHLIFNGIFVILAGWAIILHQSKIKRKAASLAVVFILAGITLALMNWSSEYIIHKENPFIRKFVPQSCTKSGKTVLHTNTLYFAGSDRSTIYLGNIKAPLYILAYDTALKSKRHFKIKLESGTARFRSVQIRILGSYFFVMDGTVPIIYRGKTSDWKAEPVMDIKIYYFSKPVIIDSSRIAFRTQIRKEDHYINVLGMFTFNNRNERSIQTELLQKQIDGFFDTDGMTNYSQESKKFVYLYYYRNQFIVTDDNLNLINRGNTIDNTVKAKIKPVFLRESGVRKLASADHVINKLSTVRKNHLFVNSSLRGRYEPKKIWNAASIVDVYDLSEKSYLSSIYLYKAGDSKMKDILVIGNYIYIIAGMELHRYTLDKNLKVKL